MAGDKIPDNKPRTLKQWGTGERNQLCLFPSISLCGPALSKAKRGCLPKPSVIESLAGPFVGLGNQK